MTENPKQVSQENEESLTQPEAAEDEKVASISDETHINIKEIHEITESEDETSEDNIIRLPVKINNFTGPLDLLVHLITKNDLDICTISISEITGEYLRAIKEWQMEDLDIAGEYLVLAATLIRLKARALLPREEQEEVEDVIPDEVLEQRRIEYERFRQLALELRTREEENSTVFPRIGSAPEGPKEVIEYTEVSVYDLYRTFQRIIEEVGNAPMHLLKNETYSVDEKMLEIEALISHNQHIVLTNYLRTLESKLEIIVVFMALLELIRLREIKAQQDDTHGEIIIIKGEKQIHAANEEYELDDDSSDE